MEESPSKRLEELIRERARLDVELERCKELVTVLFVDIVGSTRFYDEHGDVAGLVMVQKCLDLLIPLIEQHDGLVVKTIGDAILASFTATEAGVRCAVDMQRNLAERNRGRAPGDQIHVRVAVNVGLAFVKGNDVFGDLVNVTSRIESATAPDEIAISPSVYVMIQDLPDTRVRKKASAVELKGKLEKLDLYSVVWRPDETAGPAPPQPSKEQLAIATGLHNGVENLVQGGAANSVAGTPGVVAQGASSVNETMVFGAAEVEESPAVRARFVLARVCADGSLEQRYPLDHPGMIAGQEGEIPLSDDSLVAPRHARFTQLGDGVYVEDLDSPQGVFLWRREPQLLKDGDTIQIGGQRLRFVVQTPDIPAAAGASLDRTVVLAASPKKAAPQAYLVRLSSNGRETDRYELRGSETSFGRSKGTYTFPDDPYLSTSHARISLRENQHFLEDLGSTNGTFSRIRKRALVRDGDTLMIGKQLLRVLAAQSPH